MPLPRLRNLDAYPVKIDGETQVCLRDPENIQEEVILVSPAAFLIATLLDGKNDVADVQGQWAKHADGEILSSEDVRRLVSELDERYLLDSERFRQRRKQIEEEFVKSGVRPAFLADRSYPSEARKLRKMLEGFYTAKEGPGAPPAKGQGAAKLTGLIAPHIDFNRGGPAYAHAYKALAESCDADRFVVLGVAHVSPPSPYVLCDKDFETPFGNLPADRDFLSRLRGRVNGHYDRYPMTHRTEHSVEFQAVYLKYLFDRRARLVPILCSSFETVEEAEEFIRALDETIRESDGKTCVISGADLAHVGPRFGDPFQVTPQVIETMSDADRRSLEHVARCDARGFFDSVMSDGNARKVCGLTSIYTALRLLEGSRGMLLKYGYAPDPAGGVVSFASVAFHGR